MINQLQSVDLEQYKSFEGAIFDLDVVLVDTSKYLYLVNWIMNAFV